MADEALFFIIKRRLTPLISRWFLQIFYPINQKVMTSENKIGSFVYEAQQHLANVDKWLPMKKQTLINELSRDFGDQKEFERTINETLRQYCLKIANQSTKKHIYSDQFIQYLICNICERLILQPVLLERISSLHVQINHVNKLTILIKETIHETLLDFIDLKQLVDILEYKQGPIKPSPAPELPPNYHEFMPDYTSLSS